MMSRCCLLHTAGLTLAILCPGILHAESSCPRIVDWKLLNGQLGMPRGSGVAECVYGTLYAIGGVDASGTCLQVAEKYDAQNDQWTTIANMPTGRQCTCSAAIGRYIYVIGGESPNNTVRAECERYDVTTDTWASMASLNTARGYAAAAAYNGDIYVFGGYGSSRLSSIELYDPKTNTWSIVAGSGTPSAISASDAATLGDKIYLAGGRIGTGVNSNHLWCYDPETNTWDTSLPSMNVVRYHHILIAAGCRIYAIGGRPSESLAMSSVESWAPGETSWRMEPSLNVARDHLMGAGCGCCGKDIYVVGGLTGLNGTRLDSTEKSVLQSIADLDSDGDVDGFDFLTFSNCYNGSNRPPLCD